MIDHWEALSAENAALREHAEALARALGDAKHLFEDKSDFRRTATDAALAAWSKFNGG
jgi:hypothetical protein